MEELRALIPPDLADSMVFSAMASLPGGVSLGALRVWHGEDAGELEQILRELLGRPSGSPVALAELGDFQVMLAAAAGVKAGCPVSTGAVDDSY